MSPLTSNFPLRITGIQSDKGLNMNPTEAERAGRTPCKHGAPHPAPLFKTR